MAQTKLHVKALDLLKHSMFLLYAACQQRYSSGFAGRIFMHGECVALGYCQKVKSLPAEGIP